SAMTLTVEGAQTDDDSVYTGEGLFAGQDIAQARGTTNFVNEAKKHFGVNDSTAVTGLSHSLDHNNNATAHLMYDTFDHIYSVNGAQTNYYQIFNHNNAFKREVKKEFSFTSNDEIYDVDPEKLKS